MRHVNGEDLAVIVVDRGMIDDHLPNNVLAALKRCQREAQKCVSSKRKGSRVNGSKVNGGGALREGDNPTVVAMEEIGREERGEGDSPVAVSMEAEEVEGVLGNQVTVHAEMELDDTIVTCL